MRQQRWMEYLKDFDMNIRYCPGKFTVAANTLSRKPVAISLVNTMLFEYKLWQEVFSLPIRAESAEIMAD